MIESKIVPLSLSLSFSLYLPQDHFFTNLLGKRKIVKKTLRLKIPSGPWTKFSKYVQLFYFSLFLIVKPTFMPNFTYMGTFLPIYFEKRKIIKKALKPKFPSGPRAKFTRCGQLFYFSLFLIVKTTYIPNFMYIEPFFTILLRKT